jgi:hypothetical protein
MDYRLIEEAQMNFLRVSEVEAFYIKHLDGKKGEVVTESKLRKRLIEAKITVIGAWASRGGTGCVGFRNSYSTNSIYFSRFGKAVRVSDHGSYDFKGLTYIVTYLSDPIEIINKIIHDTWGIKQIHY